MSRNILIYGAGWVHNMGNAFIQMGSKVALERAVPDAQVHIIDGNDMDPPTPFFLRALSKLGNTISLRALDAPLQRLHARASGSQVKMMDLSNVDAVVLSGVWLSAKYLQGQKKDFLSLRERGIPLIINGGGGTFYDEEEKVKVTALLREIRPFALISRDRRTYETYHGVLERVSQGMDVGFFVNEAFPHPLRMRKRTVYCFDRGLLPPELQLSEDVVLTHHSRRGLQYNTFTHPTFFSELAEDYLNLYANASTVYSDRVHACVAALSFGGKARLIDPTPRAALFDIVEAGAVRDAPTALPREVLERKKSEHVEALRKVFADIGGRK